MSNKLATYLLLFTKAALNEDSFDTFADYLIHKKGNWWGQSY